MGEPLYPPSELSEEIPRGREPESYVLKAEVDESEKNEKTREDVERWYDPGNWRDASFKDREESDDSEGEGFSSPPRKIRRCAAEDGVNQFEYLYTVKSTAENLFVLGK